MDRSLIDDFREKVNDHDMVWKIYHDRNGKNQWSIICSAMDWIDVVVEEIDTSKLCSKNDNASSIKMMTFINCVDVLWESIQQLHRVIFDPRSIPFQDDSSVFTDKLYESSDNEYFKTIRACFSAHPVNLNDRFNGEGKEQRYASWSGGGFGCKDFSVMLYSNTKGMESIILDISFSELITFAEKRYNYLQVLVGEIDKQISQYNRSWKEKQIPKVDAPLKQIEILIEENEKRLQNDYYRYELQKLHIVFCTPIHNMQNCEVVQAYRNALQNAIDDLFENIQDMRLEEIHSQYLLDIDCPPEYHYSFSKLSEAMYGGNPFIVTLGGIIDYGCGYQENIAYTLTAMDRHAVFSRQRVDVFTENEIACTENARQHKDATDLVMQPPDDEKQACILRGANLIRRLTPLECERLQGFPDGWTNISGASDSACYKALGNSVAIPCVEYVMRGIAAVLRSERRR